MIFTEEDLKHIEELKTRYEDKQSVLCRCCGWCRINSDGYPKKI